MNYYGVQITDSLIHVSPLCPCIKNANTKMAHHIAAYGNEADAVIDGHKKRCAVCYNMMMFNIKRGTEETHYLMTKDQMEVLLGVVNHSGLGYSPVVGIAKQLNCNERNVKDHIRKLIKKGLIIRNGAYGKFEKNVYRPTEMGRALGIAYVYKLFGIQSEIMDQQTRAAGEYTRLS